MMSLIPVGCSSPCSVINKLTRLNTWKQPLYKCFSRSLGNIDARLPRLVVNKPLWVYQHRSVHRSVVMASGSSEDREVKKVGIVQMTSNADKNENFHQAKALIQRALILGAEMIFLPECFDYVSDSQKLAVNSAETIDGPTIQKYRSLAKQHQVWLSLGGFHHKPDVVPESGDFKISNTHLIIDGDGQIQGRYSKTHLFEVNIKDGVRLQETDFTQPGTDIGPPVDTHLFEVNIKDGVRLQETDFTQPGTDIGPPVDTPIGRVGMAICYDLRFPELSIALTQQGADILTFPSAFTVPTGAAHWETLLRCRAIENQCYVIAAAQVGKHNEKRSSYGHAMAVDPWGKVLVDCPDKPDVQILEIDRAYIDKRRREMPVWKHRRHDLYGNIQIQAKVPIDSQSEYQFGQVAVRSSQVFYRTALTLAFVNRKPVVPGHVLVTPVRPVERFCDCTAAEVADMFQVVKRVSSVVEEVHGASSLTVGIQDGPDAGQSIKHVHVHVLPRKPGDFKKNDDVYKHLESHDKDVSESEWRDDEEMIGEATALRPYFH